MRPKLVGGLGLILAGCAAASPPETDLRRGDPDGLLCRRGQGPPALAACERVLARPDPFKWPGYTGSGLASFVYYFRADSAVAYRRHLMAAGRDAEAQAAAERAVEYIRAEVQLFPASVDGWAVLGVVTNLAGQFPESIAAFEHAVTLDAAYFEPRPPQPLAPGTSPELRARIEQMGDSSAARRAAQQRAWEASKLGRRVE